MSATAESNQFRWFMAGQASWFSAFGLQAVLFPFLVVNVLLQGPERIGIAQTALMAPSLLLMMVGGALALHVEKLGAQMRHGDGGQLAALRADAAVVVLQLRRHAAR